MSSNKTEYVAKLTKHPVRSTKHPTSVWYKDAPTHPVQDCYVLLGDIKETLGHFPLIGIFNGVDVATVVDNNDDFKIPLVVLNDCIHAITLGQPSLTKVINYHMSPTILMGSVVKSLILATMSMIDSPMLYNSIYRPIYK